MFVRDELLLDFLLEVIAFAGELGEVVDDILDEVETIHVVENGHVEGGGDGAFFLVAADVDVVVIGAAAGEAVDEGGVAVEGEDNGAVFCEEGIEIVVAESVRMFGGGLEFHEIDDVDDADFEVGEIFSEDGDGGKDFESGDIAGAEAMTTSGSAQRSLPAHSQIPMPSVQCLKAASMESHCRVGGCFVTHDDDIDVVAASEAMISLTERRQLASGGR